MNRLAEPAGPDVVAVAGPNGAGKSTVGARLLEATLGVRQFVNADDIARGLSGFAPESAAFEAGRVMLRRMDELARRRETFAFETTLSGRGHARLIDELVATGYTKVYDNSAATPARPIARGAGPMSSRSSTWKPGNDSKEATRVEREENRGHRAGHPRGDARRRGDP